MKEVIVITLSNIVIIPILAITILLSSVFILWPVWTYQEIVDIGYYYNWNAWKYFKKEYWSQLWQK